MWYPPPPPRDALARRKLLSPRRDGSEQWAGPGDALGESHQYLMRQEDGEWTEADFPGGRGRSTNILAPHHQTSLALIPELKECYQRS